METLRVHRRNQSVLLAVYEQDRCNDARADTSHRFVIRKIVTHAIARSGDAALNE